MSCCSVCIYITDLSPPFQSFFPGLISACYVLRPASFLQRTWSDLSYKFSRDDFKFKVSDRDSSPASGARARDVTAVS